MLVRERGAEIVVQDAPGAHWAVGLLFAAVGMVFVLGPLGLFVNAESVGWLARGTAMVMGGCGVATGLWIWRESPRSRLAYSRDTGRVRISRVGTSGRVAIERSSSEVTAVGIVTQQDDEGSDVFQIRLSLADGAVEPVSHLWSHDGEGATSCAERLARALGVPVARERQDPRRR